MIYPFNAVEVFKIALEIEENGRKFYEDAGKKVTDPAVKRLLEGLALAEVNHKSYFSKLLAELPDNTTGSTVWDPENELDQYIKMMADQHVFRSADDINRLLAEVKTPKDALLLASQFEKDSIVLFAELKEQTNSNDSHYEVAKIMKEEQAHLRLITNMLMKISK